ncbi:acetate--CoA ligase family protein [Desulfatibacillum aliphaticivorans]|uniref:acetate--CoA ligase family protein n=1 Tax=Desulfatibacillum aliphaticivorans TaxID=218208 RepID=UPI00041FF766|nr:acetate--CoA ligase family protein [Desulfatibacillum aliphaticivorans]
MKPAKDGTMALQIHFDRITDCFQKALEDGRNALYEHETYALLKNSGAETPPMTRLIPKGDVPSQADLDAIPGEKIVLKIVSPTIFHKTDVGGVKVLEKDLNKTRSACRRMLDEVPAKYADWIGKNPQFAPEAHQGLMGEDLARAASADIVGVLLCQFMPPDSQAFGNELLVSIRRTQEFGMVITAGLGGTDTEIYAQRFRKGQAVVSASTEMAGGESFFNLFRQTIAYKKLAGVSRGQERIVSDGQLIECFSSFILMGNHYSPNNPDAPFVIEELEVNPFAFTDYLMTPLDGICRFSLPENSLPVPRPVGKIHNLLHPKNIAIIGVSSTGENFGRIILRNIIAGGFNKDDIVIVKPNCGVIDGVKCVPTLEAMEQKANLFIMAVGADQVPDLIERIIEFDCAQSVMLIPGGLGEKQGSEQRAQEVGEKINTAHMQGDGGPVFLGGNCMGLVSYPGTCDTFFIPREKLEKPKSPPLRNAALISQSGAFIITRLSKQPLLEPAYMVSIGNQNDLTAGDMVRYMKDLEHVRVIAVYMEGFNELDGLALCRAVREAVQQGKDVLFYKAGRTPEGKIATSGHTASVAGDYMVCESCVHQAGAMVADNFSQFENLYKLAVLLCDKKVYGNRLAAVSGAGFEAVGMADSIQGDDYAMKMAAFEDSTIQSLEKLIKDNGLDALVDVKNPMDINPAANDRLHAETARILAEDNNVDGVVVGLDPLSPAMQTLPAGLREGESLASPEGVATLLSEAAKSLEKPVLGVIDGGGLFDPMAQKLEENGVPVFRSADAAVAALAKYMNYRLRVDKLKS